MKNKVLFIISLLCLLLISSCANINNNTNNEDINNEIINKTLFFIQIPLIS